MDVSVAKNEVTSILRAIDDVDRDAVRAFFMDQVHLDYRSLTGPIVVRQSAPVVTVRPHVRGYYNTNDVRAATCGWLPGTGNLFTGKNN
jgi:hypothetical protein